MLPLSRNIPKTLFVSLQNFSGPARRTKRSNYISALRDPRIYTSTGSARDVALIRRILIVARPRAIVPSHLLALLSYTPLTSFDFSYIGWKKPCSKVKGKADEHGAVIMQNGRKVVSVVVFRRNLWPPLPAWRRDARWGGRLSVTNGNREQVSIGPLFRADTLSSSSRRP